MSKEKQIEEMANIIGKHTTFDTMWEECTESAEALYNAGYRKQSEVIDEIVSRLKERLYTIPTVYNAHFSRMLDDVVTSMKGGE